MADIIISVNNRKRSVTVKPQIIGVEGENLQGKFIVDFEDGFIDGNAVLDIKVGNDKGYVKLNKVDGTYQGDIVSPVTRIAGKVLMQVKVTQPATTAGTPIFKSAIFGAIVDDSINATTEWTE